MSTLYYLLTGSFGLTELLKLWLLPKIFLLFVDQSSFMKPFKSFLYFLFEFLMSKIILFVIIPSFAVSCMGSFDGIVGRSFQLIFFKIIDVCA